MNFSDKNETQTEFQIAPMIDIIFLLLVFFVVSYGMAQIEKELKINLPESSNASQPSFRMNEIVVNISANGTLTVNKQAVDAEQLSDKLKSLKEFGGDPTVIIRADGESQHKYTVLVMDICAKNEISKMVIGTKPTEAGHAEK